LQLQCIKGLKKTLFQAVEIVGNRPRWELIAIRRALSMHQWLNTFEETQRLAAVRVLLRHKGY
jgi:hypothetical protein